jgi:hypothetical protein
MSSSSQSQTTGQTTGNSNNPSGGPPPSQAQFASILLQRLPTSDNAVTAESVQNVIDDTLRELLGPLGKNADYKSFVAALRKAFPGIQPGANSYASTYAYNYSPQSVAGMASPITPNATFAAPTGGAQASLYAITSNAASQTLVALGMVDPIISTPDLQKVSNFRSVIRNEITTLLDELGTANPNGPNKENVASAFEVLISLRPKAALPTGLTSLGGFIGRLGQECGFVLASGSTTSPTLIISNQNVNNADEENKLLAYVTLSEYVKTLYNSWLAYLTWTEASPPLFFGVDLGLLRRELEEIQASRASIESVMDSVGFKQGEREVTDIPLPSTPTGGAATPTFTIDLGLSTIENFATKSLVVLDSSGKDGVDVAKRGIDPLLNWVNALKNDLSQIPLLNNPIVIGEVTSLAIHLGQAKKYAGNIVP